jgi:heme oxygenase
MGSIKGRVEAFEEYIERRVAEDLEQEVDAIVDVLEERLSREEFLKMARIISEAYSGVR